MMRVAIFGAVVLLASCSAMHAQPPSPAGERRDATASRQPSRAEQELVAAFNDHGALKQRHPHAELAGTYGEVTIWRVALTPSQWNELTSLGRYSPVFGEEGQLRALPGGVVVRLAPALHGEKADEWFRVRQLSARPLSPLPGTYVVETPPGLAALELAKQLGTSPDVIQAEPNWWREYSLRK